jgi:hypothetical protein
MFAMNLAGHEKGRHRLNEEQIYNGAFQTLMEF